MQRSKNITIYVSPEENSLINKIVQMTGVLKQEYLESNLLNRKICVFGNPKTFKGLRNQALSILTELNNMPSDAEIHPETEFLISTLLEIYGGLSN